MSMGKRFGWLDKLGKGLDLWEATSRVTRQGGGVFFKEGAITLPWGRLKTTTRPFSLVRSACAMMAMVVVITTS